MAKYFVVWSFIGPRAVAIFVLSLITYLTLFKIGPFRRSLHRLVHTLAHALSHRREITATHDGKHVVAEADFDVPLSETHVPEPELARRLTGTPPFVTIRFVIATGLAMITTFGYLGLISYFAAMEEQERIENRTVEAQSVPTSQTVTPVIPEEAGLLNSSVPPRQPVNQSRSASVPTPLAVPTLTTPSAIVYYPPTPVVPPTSLEQASKRQNLPQRHISAKKAQTVSIPAAAPPVTKAPTRFTMTPRPPQSTPPNVEPQTTTIYETAVVLAPHIVERAHPLRELSVPQLPDTLRGYMAGRCIVVSVSIAQDGTVETAKIIDAAGAPRLAENLVLRNIAEAPWSPAVDSNHNKTSDDRTVRYCWPN